MDNYCTAVVFYFNYLPGSITIDNLHYKEQLHTTSSIVAILLIQKITTHLLFG